MADERARLYIFADNKEQDGRLDKTEFSNLLEILYECDKTEKAKIFDQIKGKAVDQGFNFQEFGKTLDLCKDKLTKSTLQSGWQSLDPQGKGVINVKNLEHCLINLTGNLSDNDIAHLISTIDPEHKGTVPVAQVFKIFPQEACK